MTTPCLELVIYKVKNPESAARARAAFAPHLKAYPGFQSWQALAAAGDSGIFADAVTWASLADAKAAAEAIMKDAAAKAFMAEVGDIISYGHYV